MFFSPQKTLDLSQIAGDQVRSDTVVFSGPTDCIDRLYISMNNQKIRSMTAAAESPGTVQPLDLTLNKEPGKLTVIGNWQYFARILESHKIIVTPLKTTPSTPERSRTPSSSRSSTSRAGSSTS